MLTVCTGPKQLATSVPTCIDTCCQIIQNQFSSNMCPSSDQSEIIFESADIHLPCDFDKTTAQMEWTNAKVEDLIKVWEGNPCLWDVQTKVYKDSLLKAASGQEMGKKFDTTGKLTQQKLEYCLGRV